MDLKRIIDAHDGCASNKIRSADCVYFSLHKARDLVRLLYDFLDHSLVPMLYGIVAPRPQPREVIACLMQGKITQYYFDVRVRPKVENRLTDRTFNNRIGYGPEVCLARLMQDILEVSENYTKDAWLITRDITAFFPSTNLDRSYNNYRNLIEECWPKGEERDDLLYILLRVNYSYPSENTRLRSHPSKWEPIRKAGKSVIFDCQEGRGACLGNQFWQVEKNFDLAEFDRWQIEECGMRYGRFVDDMYWVVDNLEAGLAHVALSEKKLYEEYGYRMHPKKRYQQHVKLGGKFIGTWIKGYRMYVGNRVVRHAEESIRKWNRMASPSMLWHFLQSINSYLGIMKHRNAYRIIRNLVDMISPKWLRYCHFDEKRRCFVANEGYGQNDILLRKYHFKLHKNKHNGTRSNQRPGVQAA